MKYTIIIGTGFDKNGAMLDGKRVADVLKLLKGNLSACYGGLTLTEVTGGYRGAHGYVEEKSVKIEIYDLSDSGYGVILANLKVVKKDLNQESVLFAATKESAELL